MPQMHELDVSLFAYTCTSTQIHGGVDSIHDSFKIAFAYISTCMMHVMEGTIYYMCILAAAQDKPNPAAVNVMALCS
jgi:hypothetical protein